MISYVSTGQLPDKWLTVGSRFVKTVVQRQQQRERTPRPKALALVSRINNPDPTGAGENLPQVCAFKFVH